MTAPDEERELRQRFMELKRHDQRHAPDFETMWTGRRPARSPWRRIVPAASLAAAAMLMMWCGAKTVLTGASSPQAVAPAAAPAPVLGGGPETAPVAGGSAAFDPAPLDFLLDVPGSAPRSARALGLDSNPLQGW